MGAPELWRQSEMMARNKEQEDTDAFDPRASQRLKVPINVQKRF
jgi:hypothetical protein